MKVTPVASSREDAWIETISAAPLLQPGSVASSREDAWIETDREIGKKVSYESRPPARTRGLKHLPRSYKAEEVVASSREDAWIETSKFGHSSTDRCRVLPRGRVD